MKNIFQSIKLLSFCITAFLLTGCVHDDKYDAPDTADYQCADLTPTMTIAELKALPQNTVIEDDAVVEGYVSSSDETGNIYKYIYLQDKPENPTQGLAVSVDATSTYLNYPQGAKVYIKLKGLAMGTYGTVQLGAMSGTGFGRIPELTLSQHMFRSCSEPKATITPKEMTLADMKTANDQYIGCLISVKNAEFDAKYLCMQYAPDGETVNRQLNDATSSVTTKVVRNSGYAAFANKTIPSGNGTFVGILSKYSSTYQLFVVRDTDLDMNGTRIDGITATCQPDASATAKTVAEVKAMYTGSLRQITENATLTAKVIGNDEAGNLYKYIYVEDNTGGIKININMTSLYLDRRFQVGRTLTIGLKDLYINNKNGEIQLGALYSGNVGQVEQADMYKHFFRTDNPITTITPTLKTIENLTQEDVGRYIRIKDLQFIDSDLGKNYADGSSTSNRTLEDCSGNTIYLTTSGYADFGTDDYPLASNATEIDTGKGDVTGILSYYNGKYQIWILNLRGADLDNPRCDGSLPDKTETIYKEEFSSLANWTAISLEGSKVWSTTSYGNPAPSAYFSGYGQKNDDWLVSGAISLEGYKSAFFSFQTDGRYSGPSLEVYITDNFTGDINTTNWTKLNDAVFDTDMSSFGGFVDSGRLSLDNYVNKKVYIAFRYTSTTSAASNWEVDNVIVKGSK